MKAFFDTSVLVAVFLEDHQDHVPSMNRLIATTKSTGFMAAHSLAEVYATATRLPGKHRLSGEQALLFLEDLRERLTLITLTAEEYYRTIKSASKGGVLGGTIYDALIAQCALKADVGVIYTWNLRHFQQFGAEVIKRLSTP